MSRTMRSSPYRSCQYPCVGAGAAGASLRGTPGSGTFYALQTFTAEEWLSGLFPSTSGAATAPTMGMIGGGTGGGGGGSTGGMVIGS